MYVTIIVYHIAKLQCKLSAYTITRATMQIQRCRKLFRAGGAISDLGMLCICMEKNYIPIVKG